MENLQQQYLLAGSDLAINLTAQAISDSDASAKVCQFSNADDYDELRDAGTEAEVDEAEKNGFCQAIEPPSGTSPHTTNVRFNIHSHGYYYYALAIIPGKQMNISYIYTLGKQYYDKDEFTPYTCSVVDQTCVIRELFKITAEKCALVFIPTSAAAEPSTPYTFYLKETLTWGISIVYLCSAVFFFSFIWGVFWSINICCVYCKRNNKYSPMPPVENGMC